MKKIVFVALVLMTIVASFQSCKSVEECPAYGQVKSEQSVEKAS